jgi:hypothetical protein
MKHLYKLAITILLLFCTCFQAQSNIKNLNLQQQKALTTNVGIVVPASVASLQIGDYVTLTSADHKRFTGRVTRIEDAPGVYKVYGSVFEYPDTMFGFMMSKGGEFQGCITNQDQSVWYLMELDVNIKGYVFYKKLKFNKDI